MISFWRQLRFLLWKGLIIKKRQKIWLFAELLTPIVLFAIIALVRTRDFTVTGTQCHFDSKGFPSSGLLPFTQSFLCSISNKCNLSPTSGDEAQEINNDTTRQSILVRTLRSLSTQMVLIGEKKELFDDTIQLGVDVIKWFAHHNESTVAIPLKKLFKGSTPVAELFQKELKLNSNLSTVLADSSVTVRGLWNIAQYAGNPVLFATVPFLCNRVIFKNTFTLPEGFSPTPIDEEELCDVGLTSFMGFRKFVNINFLEEEMTSIGGNPDTWRRASTSLKDVQSNVSQLFAPLVEIHEMWHGFNTTDRDEVIAKVFCGQDPTNMDASSNVPPTKTIRTKLDIITDKVLSFLPQIDPAAAEKGETNGTRTCSDLPLHQDSNCTAIESSILRMFKPVLSGYILVTPDAPIVRELVGRLNDPLRQLSLLRDSLFQLYSIAPGLQESLYDSQLRTGILNFANFLVKEKVINATTSEVIDQLLGESGSEGSLGTYLESISGTINQYSKCFLTDRFRLMANESALEEAAVCLQEYNQYFTAIVFPELTAQSTEFNATTIYKIRHQQDLVDGTDSIADSNGNRDPRNHPLKDLKYLTYGWSFLQEAVDRNLIAMKTNASMDVGVYSQQEPYPCVVDDTFDVTMFLSLFVILSWMIPTSLLVKNIVYEKEQRLKELMRIMGLGDMIHFLSWAIVSLTLNIVSLTIISVLLKYGKIMPHVDITLLLSFLFLYSLASVMLALLLSTFFTNANLATAATALIYFLFYFPFQLSTKTKSRAFTKFTLIFPQTTLGYGFRMLATANKEDMGAWRDIMRMTILDFHVNMQDCFIAFAGQIVACALLSWYISAIYPGVYGVGQRWYFPFTLKYWFPNRKNNVSDLSEPSDDFEDINNPNFEADPRDMRMRVKIAHLSKVYGNNTKALDDLNLRLYENQITALLGHNGAGKTTTMSLLCGLYAPSSGTAHIYGRDLSKEMREVRDVLGICPQHNVLFGHLTVGEQLYFYAALKGVPDSQLKAEVQDIVESVGLFEKYNALADTLSGGMKRRLSIGIALIGGSKFVILDEPTAGVDVNSRKDIWRLLLRHKKDRTILLSTHHMDEADVLSDRIAILSEGTLKALGSSVYLKKKYGNSYKLTLLKEKRHGPSMPVMNEWNGVQCSLVEDTEEEVVYRIPIDTPSEKLEKFFESLDEKLPELNSTGYGISAPSLQQIFVSLAPKKEFKLRKAKPSTILHKLWSIVRRKSIDSDHDVLIIGPDGTETRTNGTNSDDSWNDPDIPLVSSTCELTIAHMKALMVSKLQYTKRSWLNLCFQVFLPIMLLLGSELYSKYMNQPKIHHRWNTMISAPPLLLTTALYGTAPESYMSIYGNENTSVVARSLIDTMQKTPGVGIRCLPWVNLKSYNATHNGTSNPLIKAMGYKHYRSQFYPWETSAATFDTACMNVSSNSTFTWESHYENMYMIPYNVNQTCGCDTEKEGWTCNQDDYPWDEIPSFVSENTTDMIWDLSERNLSQFRMITRFADYNTFVHVLVGGWSLGHQNVQAEDKEKTTEGAKGFVDIVDQLGKAGKQLGIDSSKWAGNSTKIIDPFAGNYTLSEVIENVMSNLDTKENVKIWFNNKMWPSLPIYYNSISNAMLRHLAVDEQDLEEYLPDLGIVTFNHPMNRTLTDAINQDEMVKVIMFRIVLLILVFCTIPAGFSVFLVNDRECHSMHLQLVSGLQKKMYWGMEYLFDFCLFFSSSLLIIILYVIIGVPEMTKDWDTALSFVLLFILFGICEILLVFLLQRFFSIPALAFVSISIGTFFVGVVTTMTVIMLERLLKSDATLLTAYNWCSYVFMCLVPPYNLGMAVYRGTYVYQIYRMAVMYLENINRSDMIKEIPLPPLLEWELMGTYVLAIVLQTIVLFLVFAVMEHGSVGVFRRIEEVRTRNLLHEVETDEDDDVRKERIRVEGISSTKEESSEGLVVKDLAKAYGSHLAVKGISFSVRGGECFGLLGLNGAGKTTTFSMMTGKHHIGHGTVNIQGQSVDHGSSEGFRYLGYCPQFDALHMKLTTRENLVFYARLRGVPEAKIPQVVTSLLLSLHLRPYSDILTSALSGGNRRKLSVAVALVSQPPVIMLDEPSAGMDPGSQQFLWTVITRLRKAGRAVILTSHSMEECEALCTRIAIMDEGRIRCIGGKQHLKNKFGEGYTLMMKLPDCELAKGAARELLNRIKYAKIEAIHCSTVFAHIIGDGITVASILHVVNELKHTFPVEDFALSQTTLDDIFLNFATAKAGGNEEELSLHPSDRSGVHSSSVSLATTATTTVTNTSSL